jgi:phosphatidylglycerol:prolipoprotein diacylglycerol transferase
MRPIPVSFHIGPLVVHTYGIGLAVTFWFAYRYFDRRLRRAGYPSEWLATLFVSVIVAAVVGARAMHVLANLSYYLHSPGQVLAIWNGGLSSWGGLLLAVPTGIVVTRRRCPQLRLGRAMDLVAPVLAAAWAMGRLLGPQLMVAGGGHLTHQWFGMYYADQPGRRLPVPIFQAAEDFAIFCVLVYVERRLRRRGEQRAVGSPAEGVAVGSPAEGVAVGQLPAPGGDRPTRAISRPSGAVIGTGMVLWGIERTLDEKLWLAYPGHLGAVLVEAAGIALAVAGVVVLVAARRRWAAWEAAGAVSSAAGAVSSAAGAVSSAAGAVPSAAGAVSSAAGAGSDVVDDVQNATSGGLAR